MIGSPETPVKDVIHTTCYMSYVHIQNEPVRLVFSFI